MTPKIGDEVRISGGAFYEGWIGKVVGELPPFMRRVPGTIIVSFANGRSYQFDPNHVGPAPTLPLRAEGGVLVYDLGSRSEPESPSGKRSGRGAYTKTLEAIGLMKDGHSASEAATRAGITIHTIKAHLQRNQSDLALKGLHVDSSHLSRSLKAVRLMKADGLTAPQAAARVGITLPALLAYARAHSIEVERPHPAVRAIKPSRSLDAVRLMEEEGLTMEQAAKRVGITSQAVWAYLRAHPADHLK